MTLRELRYLIALADHRHFGRAADACHITQSTLSIQLRKLESYLGQTLVDRQGGRPALTPIGERIVERARRLLAEADGILALTRMRASPLEGAVTLGIIPTLAPYYLPHLLQTVGEVFAKLQLVVQEGLTADLCGRLDDGGLEVALLALPNPLAAFARSAECMKCEATVQALPEPLDLDVYELRVLFDEPFLVAVPADHPLALQATVATAELDDLELLLLTDGHCLRGQALGICQRHEPQADGAMDCRATSLETLLHLVAAGRGCTLLPALAARHVDQSRVAIRPLRGGEYRRIGLVWRRTHPRGQEFKLLADTLCRASPGETTPWPAP
ncbi:hypothetical protein DNJ95_15740 [Stutzerimonas kirkiae]|uniref:HTH lysR-type domain-containing protein n=1 Tax=Stutzerimonas kirkiae TaxID=2211392 RepID=A0A4Q9R180_9GAMM|nr:LysR substrate-binding domain-containing protein [Stutzerimonas kirkiae]TBU90635.1 hypothetical protein DNJ96_16535 [Stutzerimonas kirkiae]TBV00147.1 hypothetical protein DNJ95_15740 [Stutzerimonas kirkiae]TBV14074.1 hypothetical protein DNK01_10715 [Stutzerimonas kirkiae]